MLGEVVPLLGLVDAWLLTRLTPKLVAPWASSDSASFRRFLLAMREREFGLTADEAAYAAAATVTRDDSRRIVYAFAYGTANIFEVMEQYYGWGDFLVGVTIVTDRRAHV